MRSDSLNKNSSSFGSQFSEELGGVKKVLSFAGDCIEARLDSATTAYADGDIIQYMGALDTSVPDGYNAAIKIIVSKVLFVCKTATGTAMTGNVKAGTAANEAVNGAVTGGVELFGAGATQLSPEGYDLATTATEADKINFNSANNAEWAAPHIVLPAATNHIYMCTNTTINHASNFDAGRWSCVVEYILV
tara:strand:- start:365 stop:937 length:573 start_codon:yes stop_codon:yes gene_type:complete